MTTWTGQAHLIADDIRAPGFAAAALCATAWRARVDPDATHGLVGAAMVLTDGQALSGLWAPLPPCPDDATLLRETAELEGGCAELLKHCEDMARACVTEHDEAMGEYLGARAAADHAQALMASAANPQAHAAAEHELAAAQDRMDAAHRVIADTEAALEILDDTGKRLAHALNCLRRVPDDLAGTYEQPYQLVHDGGQLPHEGDFLTGTATQAA